MLATKVGAFVTAGLALIYLVVLGQFGVVLILSGSLIGIVSGSLILVFPGLGIWSIVREFRFGAKSEALVKRVKAEGSWPEFNLELRPSGRPVRESADKVFAEYQAKAEALPSDWHSWFNLSLAYDAAGDRPRARKAMQRAIAMASE